MAIKSYFMLNPDPATGIYRIVSKDKTIDIGKATNPKDFLRALQGGTLVDYLGQYLAGRSKFWAEGQAQAVEGLLASTDTFVVNGTTVYNAPPGKSLADALSSNLPNYEITADHVIQGPPTLRAALTKAEGGGDKVSLDSDDKVSLDSIGSDINSLKSEEGGKSTAVEPPALTQQGTGGVDNLTGSEQHDSVEDVGGE